MGEYERLGSLEGEMKIVALHLAQGRSPGLGETFKARFTNAASFGALGEMQNVALGKALRLPAFSPEQRKHLLAGKSLLVVDSCIGRAASCVSMIRLIDPAQPQAGTLMAEINPGYLWDPEKLAFGVNLCVYTSGKALSCEENAALQKAVGSLERKPGDTNRLFSWNSGGIRYDSAYWKLFLKAHFLAPDWTIVFSQRRDENLAPMRHFQATFPFVVLLAVLAVILLSSIQIRRILVPLEKLAEGTEQIGAQHFEARVDVRSGDEFENLARSFNAMSSRLGRQFHALRTVHDIDQAILASLNREGIIAAVLQHMPDLLPHGCFAVALLSDPHLENLPSLSLTIPSRSLPCRRVETSFSGQDLAQLQRNHTSWLVAPGELVPEFLAPLAGEGMTAFLILPVHVDGRAFGALICAHTHVLAGAKEDLEQTRQVADQLAVALSNIQLMEALEQLHWGALSALARAIDAKSAWTAGHSERVTHLAGKIARAMGVSPKELQIMHRGGLLHDIGKIGTPPEILDKPGKLDQKEMQTMRDHVRIGVRILEPVPGLREALPIVAQHHEWFDGSGYPEGLAGEQISLHARIFAVADCYDALISNRPYRRGLPRAKVIEIIEGGSGTQFDPRVIEVFHRLCAEDPELSGMPEPSEMIEQRS
ncbi:MAG: HD domain-containing protein [Acidobacteriia bacterium]|nr:HD domain-containing protein [Terriglobia bacterium]